MSTFQGKVVSTKNEQTVTVIARRRARHPLYGKAIIKSKRYHVHDSLGVKDGDVVQFVSCRPMSKTKRWKILKIMEIKKKKQKVDSKKAKK